MGEVKSTRTNRKLRSARTRSTIFGTSERPRLTVFISNKNVSAQIIDDSKGVTLCSASSVKTKTTGTMTETAATVGEAIAKAATKKKIKKVVLDRGAKQYHGRMKALADAARENGLEF